MFESEPLVSFNNYHLKPDENHVKGTRVKHMYICIHNMYVYKYNQLILCFLYLNVNTYVFYICIENVNVLSFQPHLLGPLRQN